MYSRRITMFLNYSRAQYAFLLTESRACIKSAFTVDNGFPVIKMVNVSSFSEVIKLPNQDFLVISGEDSGVGLYTGSISTVDMKIETQNNINNSNVTTVVLRTKNVLLFFVVYYFSKFRTSLYVRPEIITIFTAL